MNSSRTTKLKRVYLSGPIRGRANHNRPAFEMGAELLRDAGYDVVNPHELVDHQDGELKEYMAIELPHVCQADFVALLPGWEDSQGAKLEAYVAIVCGIPVKSIKDLL